MIGVHSKCLKVSSLRTPPTIKCHAMTTAATMLVRHGVAVLLYVMIGATMALRLAATTTLLPLAAMTMLLRLDAMTLLRLAAMTMTLLRLAVTTTLLLEGVLLPATLADEER